MLSHFNIFHLVTPAFRWAAPHYQPRLVIKVTAERILTVRQVSSDQCSASASASASVCVWQQLHIVYLVSLGGHKQVTGPSKIFVIT